MKGLLIVTVAFSGLLLACGSAPPGHQPFSPTPAVSGTPTPTASPTPPPEPTFTWIAANVLPRCQFDACHNDNSDAPIVLYTDLVDAPTTKGVGCDGRMRVVASDLGASVLATKLTISPICGGQMPNSGLLFSGQEAQAVSDWIAAGALNN